jgi:hypothetical protein
VSASTKSITVGVAAVSPRHRTHSADTRTRSVTLYQFQDSETLTALESLLVRLCPQICHVPALSGVREAKLKNVLEVLGVAQVHVHKPKEFDGLAGEACVAELRALCGEDEVTPNLLRVEGADWALAVRAASLLAKAEALSGLPRASFALSLDSMDMCAAGEGGLGLRGCRTDTECGGGAGTCGWTRPRSAR